MKIPPSERLNFAPFIESDAPALAELLADSSITRNITSNGSTPERCLVSARKRISWHNSAWTQFGYGVWSLRAREPSVAPRDKLLGWCGFTPPDDDDPDPEILYAIRETYRGTGLASEAARHAIAWLFSTTQYQGVTAVISTPLNPGSVNVVTKLDLRYRQRMPFSLFLSGGELADEVVEYEIWRLAYGPQENLGHLIEQVAFRVGQVSTVTSLSAEEILKSLEDALLKRCEQQDTDRERGQYQTVLSSSFSRGRNDAYMDCYYVTKEEWLEHKGKKHPRL